MSNGITQVQAQQAANAYARNIYGIDIVKPILKSTNVGWKINTLEFTPRGRRVNAVGIKASRILGMSREQAERTLIKNPIHLRVPKRGQLGTSFSIRAGKGFVIV